MVVTLALNLAFYFYNTKAGVDRFLEAVKDIQKFFGQ